MNNLLKHFYHEFFTKNSKQTNSLIGLLGIGIFILIVISSAYINIITVSNVMKDSNLQTSYSYVDSTGTKMKLAYDDNMLITNVQNTISKTYLLNGSLENDSVVIDYKTSVCHNLNVGDSLKVGKNELNVSGIVFFPNLISPNMSPNSFSPFSCEDYLIGINNEQFEELGFEYETRYLFDNNEGSVTDSYVYTEQNIEINSIQNLITMFQLIIVIVFLLFTGIILIVSMLLIYSIIEDNAYLLGIMNSFGIPLWKAILSLFSMVFMISLFMYIPYIFSYWFSYEFFEILTNNLNIYNPKEYLNLNILMLTQILLVVMVLILILKKFYKYYQLEVIDIINMNKKFGISRVKKRIFRCFKNESILRKLKLKSLFSTNIGSFLMFFAGFSLVIQLMLAIGLGSFYFNTSSFYNEFYNFEYIYYGNNSTETEVQNFVEYKYKYENEDINLIVLENSKFDALDLEINENNNGVAISRWYSNKHNLSEGDVIDLNKGDENIEYIVEEITDEISGKDIYTYNNLAMQKDSILGFYSSEKKEFDYTYMINKSEYIDSIIMGISNLKIISLSMVIIGLTISSFVFFTSIFIIFSKSKNNIINLMKEGISFVETLNLLVSYNILWVLLGCVIALPYYKFLNNILFKNISKESIIYFDFDVSFYQYILITSFSIIFSLLIILISTIRIKKAYKL